MKRARIMLMSIAVLATVGTALAFKVAKKGEFSYCYERTSVQPTHCLEIINQAEAVNGTQIFYYTTKVGTTPCNQLDCNKTAQEFIN